MGTRSVVAIPDGDGWKGRYVHWDGYPAGVGESLRQIVVRDGLEPAIKTLTEAYYGWSSLNPDAEGELDDFKQDGRFTMVHGYGEGYTTKGGQSSPEDWITSDGDDWGTEWAYVLRPEGIEVLERRFGRPNEGDRGHGVGMFGLGASDTEHGGYWLERGHVAYDDETGMEKLDG